MHLKVVVKKITRSAGVGVCVKSVSVSAALSVHYYVLRVLKRLTRGVPLEYVSESARR